MSGDDGDRPSAAPAHGGTDGGGNRKRRMSKRERKNLKKKKGAAAGAGGAGDAAQKEPAAEPSATDTSTAPATKRVEPTLEEYMEGYVPAPSASKPNKDEDNDDASQSLGKWFPKASVVKSRVCYSNDYLAKLAKERKKRQRDQTNSSGTAAKEGTEVEVVEPKASLVLFYQYVSPTWSPSKVSSFLSYLTIIAKHHRTNIGGRIRASTEGVNATVSAASTEGTNLDPAFEAARTLRHFTQDLRQFDPVAFAGTDFKFIDGLSADRHFKELKLLPVKELVFYGIREEDCAVSGRKASTGSGGGEGGEKGGKEVQGGVHLEAKEYHEMLKRKDAVVIDVRNHYEAAIGRFDGQMGQKADAASGGDGKGKDAKEGKGGDGQAEAVEGESGAGAEYIDPKMRKSTDFTSWLAEPDTKKKLEGKTVMMFCTGGIRCERASAYLNSQMGREVKGVYQLQGGIERYLQAFPEGGFWRGKNFVFDKREAIGAGNVNGDGGVVRKDGGEAASKTKGAKEGKDDDNKLLPWGTECAKCRRPWDRYIGKRKCFTCGVPVLVCDACMSSRASSSSKKKKKRKNQGNNDGGDAKLEAKDDKKAGTDDERIRCPLCVEEGVTVPAANVEYTDNGVRGRLRSSSFSEGAERSLGGADTDAPKQTKGDKAAKSVLKWGGGHAAKKKEKRKFSRRLCQFGVDCVRKDCFFYHPEREMKKQKASS